MGGTFESAWKNKFDYFFLQEHGFFNDSSKYGNVNVSGLKVNEKDRHVNVTFKLCLVVIKKDTGFLEDVIKMWKKFGKESVTEQEFTADGECSFCCNGSFTYTIPDSFLVVTKSYLLWYERQRPGTGTSRSQTSNIVLRELLAESAWCNLNRHFSSLCGFQSSLLPIYFCNGPNTCLHCYKDWKKPVWYVTIHFQYQRAFSSPEPSGGLSTRTRRLRGYRIEVIDFRTSGHFRIKSKLGDSLLKALNHVNWILDRARFKHKLTGRAGTWSKTTSRSLWSLIGQLSFSSLSKYSTCEN